MALPTISTRVFGALKKISICKKISVPDTWSASRNTLQYSNVYRSLYNGSIKYRPMQWSPRGILRLRQTSLQEQQHRPQLETIKGFQSIQQNVDSKSDGFQQQRSEQAEEDARKRKHMKWTFWGFGIFGSTCAVILICNYGAPRRNELGNLIEDEYMKYSVIPQYILRFYREALSFKKAIEEPSRVALLPDPLTAPYRQAPYTLCLEIIGVLVNPEWSYTTGWRFKKRPGVNFLLQQLAMNQLFEIVIYTKESGLTAYPIIDSLDPQGYIMYRLFKDATRYQEGQHIKDLSALNRPINRVIHIDCDDKAVQLNRSNAVCLKKWSGEMDDRSLVDLAIFLRTIAESGVDDVRSVLEYYSQFEDPLKVFRENQRKLAEHQLQSKESLKSNVMPAWSAFKRR
ncbi:mitochondrial import inner membrane translocase subunit TIM50-C-like [Tropilaelaps mercedesae]|uniref:Mitochondrial import inner membrane translocase subunit TIM50 n=1 Tax=Tropilaelaps mercedesae TaxID=418985 RepID=A0A1V9XYV7_9ACAR|nr:mitochondrial import inner membrane translocase subunit TIM50-C-like [Tropilaelaps mercedesae]